MDNISLQSILLGSASRTFWIKTIGIPGEEPDLHQLFTLPNLTVEFARQPNSIEIGDILIIHRIGIGKVVYVAECKSPAREVTVQEIREHPFMEHWHWTMELRNLTPIYGRHWAENDVKPFTLVREYNELNPTDKQNLGSLKFGGGHQQISSKFGEFLLQKIMDIK
jgi:hypothetical protein